MDALSTASLHFQVTNCGLSLTNASAGKPIDRRTAERVLTQFIERVDTVNSTHEYAYGVELVVLFGSMHADRPGTIRRRGRRNQATTEGRGRCSPGGVEHGSKPCRRSQRKDFYGVFKWTMWPIQEVFLHPKARKGSLSLHDFCEVEKRTNLRYRRLLGDPQQIAAIFANGQAVGFWVQET